MDEKQDRLGMTDEQWARFQEYTHGYGEQSPNGFDLVQIRTNLALTPAERLRKLQESAFFGPADFHATTTHTV